MSESGLTSQDTGIVQLTRKIARLCSKERTIEGFGLSRTPVFSLSSSSQLSSRGRRLGAIFINLTMPPRGMGYACHAIAHHSRATCWPGAPTWVRAAPCTGSTPSVPLKVDDAITTMTAIRVARPRHSRRQHAS